MDYIFMVLFVSLSGGASILNERHARDIRKAHREESQP